MDIFNWDELWHGCDPHLEKIVSHGKLFCWNSFDRSTSISAD